jgi:hypothetical protein
LSEVFHYLLEVFRGVDGKGFVLDGCQFNAIPIFESPQLFQFFKFFQRGWFHFGEPKEEGPGIYIHTNMFKDPLRERSFCTEGARFETINLEVTRKGDGGPRKIESKVLLIDNDFHHMGIQPILDLVDSSHQRGDGDGFVREKRSDGLINDRTFDQGFIPLDIDDNL